MRCLVTGAGGFVGRHLVEHLRAMGDEVVGTDRSDGGPDVCDATGMAKLLADVSPEAIYHLAGDADVGGSWDHPLDTFRANAVGTLTLLVVAREAGAGRVLCVSSADVYGRVSPDALPIAEDAPLEPVSPYAASKVAADLVARQAWLGHGQDVIRIRAFNHLGPGQSTRFIAPAIATRILEARQLGQRSIAVGNLTPRRDITDVRDVVRAYRLLAERGEAGEAYNVCSGRDVAVADIVDSLIELSGGGIEVEPDPALQRPVDTPVLVGDHSKLTAVTGWQPAIPLDQTLRDVLDDRRAKTMTGSGT